MTNMSAMPIYGRNLKKIFSSETERLMTLNLGMQHQVVPILFKWWPFFTARSKLPYLFVWEHTWTVGFLEAVEVCDLNIGT